MTPASGGRGAHETSGNSNSNGTGTGNGHGLGNGHGQLFDTSDEGVAAKAAEVKVAEVAEVAKVADRHRRRRVRSSADAGYAEGADDGRRAVAARPPRPAPSWATPPRSSTT